jgi:hypothetical protein
MASPHKRISRHFRNKLLMHVDAKNIENKFIIIFNQHILYSLYCCLYLLDSVSNFSVCSELLGFLTLYIVRKVQIPINSECYTTSSEIFRICFQHGSVLMTPRFCLCNPSSLMESCGSSTASRVDRQQVALLPVLSFDARF